MQTERPNLLEEGAECGRRNCSSQPLDEGGVFFKGGIEGFVHFVDSCGTVSVIWPQFPLNLRTFLSIPSTAVQFAQFAWNKISANILQPSIQSLTLPLAIHGDRAEPIQTRSCS